MASVLILSSYVAAGTVGLSAARPVLTALGCEVIGVPTVVLSNHKAWPAVAGEPVAPAEIMAMVRAIDENGWLATVDAVVVGYLPSAGAAHAAAETIERVRRRRPVVRVVCDPVFGDDPKGLYAPREVAEAVRDALAPRADMLTPNRFELEWLAAAPIKTREDAVTHARKLIERYGLARVLLTSPPMTSLQSDRAMEEQPETGVMEISAGTARLFAHEKRAGAPNGVGDVFAGLIAAGGETGAALGVLRGLIEASLNQPHLAVQRADLWRRAQPVEGRLV